MSLPFFVRGIAASCLLAAAPLFPALAAETLTLEEVEQSALASDPLAARFEADAAALREEAVAARQLPDPKLRLGVESLPLDSLSLSAEPMTQLQVGVMQEFPRGAIRELSGLKVEEEAAARELRAREQRRRTLREVRERYLDAWFRGRAVTVMEESRSILDRVVQITEAQYGAGRDNRQDVLRARLERSLLDDRLSVMRGESDEARAELARWIGVERAQAPLASELPSLPASSVGSTNPLLSHPRALAASAEIGVAEREAAIAGEEYKPGFGVELSYGKRFGEDPGGMRRGDMLSAMVTIDLPLFTAKRQDRRLAAAQRRTEAVRFERDDVLRELRTEQAAAQIAADRLDERLDRYRREVIPQVEQNAESAMRAYQSRTSDFTELLRAQMMRIDSRLQLLQLEVEAAKRRAALAYFGGEQE